MVRRSHSTWVLKGVVLGVALLALATGFCVFGDHAGNGHHHGVAADVCFGILALPSILAPLVALAATGWVAGLRPPSFVLAPLHVRKPPPKRSVLR